MFQQWEDLLFAHWPLPSEVLRPLVPPALSLDTFGGRAWLAVTPFRVTGLRLRWLPPVPGLSSFPELNVRTYATAGQKPGVYFLSLDAGSALAVVAARQWFLLPYFAADMTVARDGQAVRYATRRRSRRETARAEFRGTYRGGGGPVFQASQGTLEHFLIERYCLYTTDAAGQLYRGEIDHPPWAVETARWDVERNTMAQAHGIELPDEPPHLLLAQPQPTRIWSLERVSTA
jgi:uncharacterized protein YqjF (DUF2071 family)